jgi:putative transposase
VVGGSRPADGLNDDGRVRGLSVRDVEAALTEALGEQASVSKSTSRVCEQISTEFGAWSARRLDDIRLDYLLLDGSHFRKPTASA